MQIQTLISEDQDEPLPLNWDVLAVDWDHTYFIVWIYVVLSLKISDSSHFEASHTALNEWLSIVQDTREVKDDRLFAEESELDTINLMVDFVAQKFGHHDLQKERIRNLASFILKEEVVRGISCSTGAAGKAIAAQDMLCINLR